MIKWLERILSEQEDPGSLPGLPTCVFATWVLGDKKKLGEPADVKVSAYSDR